jgi:hypothetical protein
MKTLLSTIFALGLLAVASGANAQTLNVAGRVPFDFVVGDQTYPGGEYSLQSVEGAPEVITIRNKEDGDARMTLTRHNEKLNPAEKTVLVFHRFGDQYFLSEVWVAGSSRGISIPRSPIETKMAKNATQSDAVMVAARIVR